MKDLGKIHQAAKRYYIESSLAYSGQIEMQKGVQGLGIIILFFENSLENEFIIRDSRNLIFDLQKTMPNKDCKRLLKGLLKIIK
jgi:hypothetical protein